MSYSNGKITAPVSASDPYMVIGVGQYNGVYDVAYICGNTHGKINKLAKYKPVKVNTQVEITDTQRNGVRFGLTIPLRQMADIIKSSPWSYNPPIPGTDWCRLTDFINYNHNAIAPVKVTMPTELKTNGSNLENYLFTPTVGINTNAGTAWDSATCLSVQNVFDGYMNYYPTVILYYAAGERYYIKSADKTLQNYINSNQLTIPVIINISDTPFYDMTDGQQIQCIYTMCANKYDGSETYGGNAVSFEYIANADRTTYSLKVVDWLDGVQFVIDGTATNSVSGSTRTITLTSLTIKVTVPDDWIENTIFLRGKATIAGTTGSTTNFITDEFYISKDEFLNSRTYTKTFASSELKNRTFTIASTAHGVFSIYAFASKITLSNNDTQWNAYGESIVSKNLISF